MTSSQIRCAIRVEVLLLTDLLTQTLDIKEAKTWLLETQISDYRLGPTFAGDVRSWLADMPHRELARRLSGGLTTVKFRLPLTIWWWIPTRLMTLL